MKNAKKRIFAIFYSVKEFFEAVVAVVFVLFSSVVIHLCGEDNDGWPNLNEISQKNNSETESGRNEQS